MWITFAIFSAFFAGITSILSKLGTGNISSNAATAIRTVVVFIFAWLLVFAFSLQGEINQISPKTLLFLVLSGLATGASWLCYFKVLKIGDVNKVTPIDKSSTILTMLLAFIFLHEEITYMSAFCIVMIAAGTYMMIEKKKAAESSTEKSGWLIFAVLSAVFAALTSILGKIGISDVNSTLGTAIRTSVVLVMAWVVVFISGGAEDIKQITKKSLFFLVISGITTGLSWLCYYKALQDGPASIVVPIDKLSILVTIAFSGIILKEKLTKKSFIGLILLTAGTLLLLKN